MNTTCVSCGESLVLNRQVGAYQCVNSACGLYGQSVQTCEVCSRYSVSGDPPSCRNPECAAFERARSGCPVCQRSTLVTISGLKLCLNSSCSSHEGVTACWFCGESQMSKVQHKSPLFSCRNPACDMVLKLVRPCPVCNSHSFDLHQGRCLNNGCPTQGRKVSSCPSCGKKRYFGETPGEQACANQQCALYFGLGEVDATQSMNYPASTGDSEAVLEKAPANPFGELDDLNDAEGPEPITREASPVADDDVPDEVDVTMQMFSGDVERMMREAGGHGATTPPAPAQGGDEPTSNLAQAATAQSSQPQAHGSGEPEQSGHERNDGQGNGAAAGGGATGASWGNDNWRDTAEAPEEEPERIERIQPEEKPTEDFAELGVGVHTTEPSPAAQDSPSQAGGAGKPAVDSHPQPVDPASLGAGLGNGGLGAMPQQAADDVTDEEIEVEPDKIDFEVAFKYLQKNFIKPPGKKPSPLYLVIGLSGVGKTCFLTMLGQVLLGTKFYTPRENIKPQIVRIDNRYRSYVRDLVYDFSSSRYDHFLSHGLWPPADIPGQTSEFLVTELLNRDGEMARLATLEISGEVYQDFLPKVAEVYTDPSTLERFDPTHRIIWNLMQEAEGLVVLLEASSDWQTRTQMYTQFFQSLYQWKAGQVRDILVAQYEQFLQLDEKDYPLPLRIITGGLKKRSNVDFDSFAGEVKMKVQQCIQTLDDHGINALFVNHFQTFEELRILYSLVDPENVPLQRLVKILESDPNYQDSNNQLQAFHSFIKGFFNKFITDKSFLQEVYEKQTSDNYDVEDYWKIFQRYICWHYGLNEEELQLYDLTPSVDRSEMQQRPFEKLKYLSIVFTKTDKDFAIYPASNFPKVVNVDWAAPLPRLGNYLTLCNGYLKYYNASVSGYSVRKDAGFQLGRRGTLTPINIADPILDMLTFTGQPPLLGVGEEGA